MKKTVVGFFSYFFLFCTALAIGGTYSSLLEERPAIPSLPYDTDAYYEYQGYLFGQDFAPIILIVVFYLLASFFMSWHHRLKKKKKSQLKKEDVKPPFVLYLRSFIDDKLTGKNVSPTNDVRTEEEVFVDVMSDIAPVYAIGDPKDKDTPLGAYRIYVPDEHWKSTVVDLASRAEVVVLRLGKTDSFWWEVEMALQSIPMEKLLFVIPVSDSFDSIQILYKYLIEHNVDTKDFHINIGKKRRGSISCVLYFDKDGTSHSSELVIHRFTSFAISYDNVLRKTLEGFRQRFGLKTPKMNIRLARIFFFAIALMSVLACVMSYVGDALTLYAISY